MRLSIVLVAVFAICNGSFAQGIGTWIDLENRFVLEPLAGQAVEPTGLGLRSQAGLFIPGTSAAPFTFHLADPTPQQITYGSLGFGPRIAGSTPLDVRYDVQSALEMELNPCEEIELLLGGGATSACSIPGDADFSGTVDFADFLVVSDNYGKADTVWPSGDFDWDRKTGFTDFLLLSENFGKNFYDLAVQPGEPVSVRTSTNEEIEYLTGEFSPTPFDPIGGYWVHEGLLWSGEADADSNSDPIADNAAVTIVAPDIDNGRAVHFGAELTRVGNDFELVSVRMKRSPQTAEFLIPDDLGKSLVLPVGTLESGQYAVGITRYEFTGGADDFDVAAFLADPGNYELPDGPMLSSLTKSTLNFQVGTSEAVSVPEPRLQWLSISAALLACLAHRRSRHRR